MGLLMYAHALSGDDDIAVDERRARASREADAAMNRYADGDVGAFGVLYDVLGPRLYSYIHRQTRDDATAEDLVQQTMLQLHCARDSFVRGAAVTPWAFAIARRLLIDGFRRSKYMEQLSAAPDEDEEPISTDGRPDEIFYSKQLATRMERTLMTLPESHRVAFQLVRLEGLSVAETADVLGTTPNAVKLRAHRTYEALRKALADGERGGA